MAKLSELPSRDRDDPDSIHVVIESPRGARMKLKYEPALDVIMLSRPLVMGLAYPFDWGFVPSTIGEDGDPVDAMMLADAPTYPGVVVACHAIGVLEVTQKKKGARGERERNDRVITVPAGAPRHGDLKEVHQLPARVRDELAHFFEVAVAFQEKELDILRWGDAATAERLIRDGERRFASRHKKKPQGRKAGAT